MSQLLEGPAMLKSHVLQQRFRTDLLNIREAFRSDVRSLYHSAKVFPFGSSMLSTHENDSIL